jgi:GNAT superfamily N-acetyltransferase
MSGIKIAKGYIPGSIGGVSELHGDYCHEDWGFGLSFEAKVAVELSGFLKRYDESHDGFWTALVGGRIEGSIAIDSIYAESEGAHLRWFIMSDVLRGKGIGSLLIDTALDFCRSEGYKRYICGRLRGSTLQGISTRKVGSRSLKSKEEASGGLRSMNSDSSAPWEASHK